MSGAGNIRDILIAGGTLAGWMTAAGLVSHLPADRYRIRLVEPAASEPELETLAGGVATLPWLRAMHGLLGLSEEVLSTRANAGFSLGTEFVGWSRAEARYFRPFAPFGATLDGIAFHNLWLRMRRAGEAADIEEYSLSAMAAKLGRFAFPAPNPASPLSTLEYGHHLDGEAYRRLVRGIAEQRGVQRIEGTIGTAVCAADGAIAALVLADGTRLEADFFFDCTGSKATLIGAALGTPFEDWSHWLPCDRVVAAVAQGERVPYLHAEATASGWQWRMPLTNGVGIGRVYASAHMGHEEAVAGLPADATTIAFASGRRAVFWQRNCVAIGAAACVIDPLEPSALQAIQRGITQFLALMPFRDGDAGGADEYNRIMIETVERMRDLVILHYKANTREGAFWSACRDMTLPEELASKMRLFKASARVQVLDEEMFEDTHWVATYLGQDISPRSYSPLADTPNMAMVRDRMAAMRKALRSTAETMPHYGHPPGGAR